MIQLKYEDAPWPLEIKLSKSRMFLTVTFDNGETRRASAETLRVNSPSAEVQGHGRGKKVEVTGKEDVKITQIDPIGNYAVRLVFDDGHKTGLYTWEYFYALAS